MVALQREEDASIAPEHAEGNSLPVIGYRRDVVAEEEARGRQADEELHVRLKVNLNPVRKLHSH